MTISTKKPLYAEVHNVPDNYEFTDEELNRIIAGDMFTPRQDAIMAREIQKLRAAMLHGAELVSQTYKLNELSGNSTVTPDGWISCSERMPDTKTAVLVAVEFDRKGDWRMKWATYIPGHPDANDGWIIPGASWKPSHWMPLPEPPQEVN
ncbi:DUF551 domain-containing protein [Escherichia coli]